MGRIAKASPEQKLREFEIPFLRLIHLVAHHPDFSRDSDDVLHAAKSVPY